MMKTKTKTTTFTDTDANRTVSRKPIKVMSEPERRADFERMMKRPKGQDLAQAKLDYFLALVGRWEEGYTEEELDGMPDEEYSSHQSRLRMQAGFVDSGEALEAWMFSLQGGGNVKIFSHETAPPAPQTYLC
jgi:hypothetical protein